MPQNRPMRLLITRPAEDADALARKLAALGHVTVVAPLLAVRFLDGPEISLDGVQAILATSANGVRAIARRTPRRNVPLFAVGPQTAEAAQRANFITIKNAQGDGDALARATCEWTVPDNGTLLHAASADAPKSLAAQLTQKGFTVRREVLYDVTAAAHLPDEAASALMGDLLDAVLLFSPRSARVFRECVTADGLAPACASLTAFCISSAVAAALDGLAFRAIRVAKAPDQDALLALLE